ncbi:CAMK/CAMKL/Kin4 protein kinase [Coprinopsis sp. MPI-PUGE-AT-0042]|nr:CAMK/CAMKL/Kin4 protein kinase [Coprinopsis sp. MPI-PUGE-AT-0042]
MASSNHSASLQIPQVEGERTSSRHGAQNGSSQQASAYRPASVAVHSAAPSSPHSGSTTARRQQRASHSVVSGSATEQEPAQPRRGNQGTSPYPDVYDHPAAVAYAAAHPKRSIPKFGPYLLLQTLGEGEFGKVKLGLHVQWGEEVAVKLIRRTNMGQEGRLAKVEREIEVLRTLKHPNIVRLYDVIETDKYIGIILECASGGELFDHILAHRHLRERDAAKLFSQLISGVWYIHQKKIVHRDLKLENLLLDRHRNVIITDFGFANRFEHKADDLMQTSCGSPCYAAPELVISEGMYVGTAVDIWSCGVILYAMLAGYLPFDDDPANPDGDNINLLYRYIVNTPLSFPDFISTEARDLLGLMLVPDPARRADLDTVMRHPWLAAYAGTPRTDGVPSAFGKSVADLERAAMEQHQQKRLAYQKQMKAAAATSNPPPSASRTQSHRPEPTASNSRSRSAQPEFIYDSSADQSVAQVGNTTPKQNGSASANFDSPARLGLSDDDPFAPPPGTKANAVVVTTTTTTTSAHSRQRTSEELARQAAAATSGSLSPSDAKTSSSKGHRSSTSGGGSARHTIQVEYAEPKTGRKSEERTTRERTGSHSRSQSRPQDPPPPPTPEVPSAHHRGSTKDRRPSQSNVPKPLLTSPSAPSSYRGAPQGAPPPSVPKGPSHAGSATPTAPSSPEIPIVNVSSPPPTPSASQFQREKDKDTSSQTSGSSRRGSHRKGKSSIDRLGISKIFGSGGSNNAPPVPTLNGSEHNLQSPHLEAPSREPSEGQSSSASVDKDAPPKKTRRNTLTVMVEPFIGTIRGRGKGKPPATPTAGESTPRKAAPETPQSSRPPLPTSPAPPLPVASQTSTEGSAVSQDLSAEEDPGMSGASTNKARKVMQWFRTKSKGRESMGIGAEGDYEVVNSPVSDSKYRKGFSASSTNVNQPSSDASLPVLSQVAATQSAAPPSTPKAAKLPSHPQRSASSAADGFSTPSFVARFRNSVTVGNATPKQPQSVNTPHGQLRIHVGAVDQTTITTKPPPQVMAQIKTVLEGMGMQIHLETEYKYRCVRQKKGKVVSSASASGSANSSLAAVQVSGSAGSNGVDRRGLPLPSPGAFTGTGNMLKGLLMRRQSSQVASLPSANLEEDHSVVVSEPSTMTDIAYGDPTQDAGDEVRFSVEITRIDRLNDTYSLDIRRLKGNLRSYKWLYDTIRDRADLQS